MAEKTVDEMLDGGAACLQYFKDMLDIAKWLSFRQWPDWRDYVCRNYDNERGIDLASLRGDAVMLRQQATAARQAVTDQATARTGVQTAWPDTAGRAAVTTLNAHQTRSEPAAVVLERTATAAEAVPDAVVAAVAAKISALSEFTTKDFDIGWGSGLKMTVLGALTMGTATAVELNEVRIRFENQLGADLVAFTSACTTASSAIHAAYAAVPAAGKGIDASPFPAPSFGTITATTTQSPTAPSSPVTSGGGGGGGSGSPTSSSPSTTSPSSTTPSSTTPTSTSPTSTSPTTTSPTTTGATTPTTTGASTTPSSATPSAGTGTGTGKDSGSSWLSQLLPKIAEQLGLGDKDKAGDGKDADKDDKAGDKDGDKDAKDEKVLGTDALGRTVTATLSPDGKTVEVTAKKPDGTVEKATLKVGEDGKLTPVDGEDGAGKDGAGKDGAGKDGAGKDGAGKDGAGKEAGSAGAGQDGDGKADGSAGNGTAGGGAPSTGAGAAATPTGAGTGAATPTSSADGASPGAGATPSAAAPPVAPTAPSRPSNDGGQNPAPAGEPCPPEAPAEAGTGAEFAVSGT
ncbi:MULTISPECIES: hypothetical protein [Tsukamurella]|uniref:Uncharacterized protein n=1 Tax=Tsukamurella conjunctivitidis TaxID=2592068 RepID=A0A5C5S928_9ACTN|nr:MULTISPECIES: hypothetical protein [Tsukamurella]TWS30881.1 hypothetical protein FK530_03190 [Tsukamurella conjunctivitidis]